MDSELQNICRNLSEFDLTGVLSLKKHYESSNTTQLTKKIKSIQSFKGLLTPMNKVTGGFIPDFNSRYFTADFPFGLAILVQIADLVGEKCPVMQEVFDWYKNIQPEIKCFSFADYGIFERNQFINFYRRFL